MTIRTPLLAALTLLLTLASPAQAFDDQRQGFTVGLGLGYAHMDLDYEPGATGLNSGIASSIRLGFGLDDRFSLLYVNEGAWYRRQGHVWFTGLSGLGATWHLSPRAPSAYLLGAFGMGSSSQPFNDGVDVHRGAGYLLGAGYEFAPHLNLEANYTRNHFDKDRGLAGSGAFRLLFNLSLY